MEKLLKRVGCKKRASNSNSSENSIKTHVVENEPRSGSTTDDLDWFSLLEEQADRSSNASESDELTQPNQAMTCRFSRILHLDHPICDLFNSSGSVLSVMDFNPAAFLSKRFGNRKNRTNDLYRSNSFKFEGFERKDSSVDFSSEYGLDTLHNQISLREEYCLPVDFVNRRRPASLGRLHVSNPDGAKVEIIENYSDPRDSKTYLEPGEDPSSKLYTSPDSEYSEPFSEISETKRTERDANFYEDLKAAELNELKRVTPYYYGDIHKIQPLKRREKPPCRKSVSLDTTDEVWMPTHEWVGSVKNSDKRRNTLYIPNKKSLEESFFFDGYPSNEILHSPTNFDTDKCSIYDTNSTNPRILDELDLDEMTRQRHVYETAFDSKVSKADEDQEIHRVASSHLLQQNASNDNLRRFRPIVSSESQEFRKTALKRQDLVKKRPTCPPKATIENFNDILCDELCDLEIDEKESSSSTNPSPLRGSQVETPPSTAPLPSKFHSLHSISSTQSAPSIRIPIENDGLSSKFIRSQTNSEERPRSFIDSNSCNSSKQRPRSLFCPKTESYKLNKPVRGRNFYSSTKILEIKSRPDKIKYSSTESMACTSSSGGSLESIRSSTSEDNRSTTSTGSHMSSSISSNSSESTNQSSGSSYHCPITISKYSHQQNKLHILSPISDKSSQEPASEKSSETSDNNKNNNSQKASPEDTLNCMTPVSEQTASFDAAQTQVKDTRSAKRRTPFNKNLVHLNFTQNLSVDSDSGGGGTNQNSDSGISIESKYSKSKPCSDPSTDFSDLPFDMPKLRRKRLQMQQNQAVQDTSSSATSVDLKDLPFDMPKLRRKLRNSASTQNPSSSLASSSNSVQDSDSKTFTSRTQLTLNLSSTGTRKEPKSLGLNLKLGEVTSSSLAGESFDVNVPLERQTWYHGSITRVEAENILRHSTEGSYLVRNSESSRQDYSLSLKSARGFMHMRIQREKDSNQYILGHFSNPFVNIPSMINHYSVNRIPIRGAEHMRLLHPVPVQLL